MKKGLIIGGWSGIGNTIFDTVNRHQSDEGARLFGDVDWTVPSPNRLNIAKEPDILDFVSDNGPYEYIVYSAGWNKLDWVKDLSSNELCEAFHVNVFGFVMLLGALELKYPETNFSAVSIVSDAAKNPMRGSLAYCASKAAMAMAIKCMAREWAGKHRVNGVAPAVVADTPMSKYIDATVPGFRGWTPKQAAEYEKSMLPLGRRVTREEVAGVVANILVGPEYMTGSIVDITGGK